MRYTKWIYFGYLAIVGLVILGIAISFFIVPERDAVSLYTAYGSNIKTLDPCMIGDTTSSGVAGGIFECLYNYDYSDPPYKLIPEIAADMPKVSEDGKTYTIPLRKGIRFYDPDKVVWPNGEGPEIKARDIIYSWKRMCDFNMGSANYSQIFEDKIEGMDEFRKYTKETPPDKIDWDKPISGFQILDDYTIRIVLTQPFPQLRFNLGHLPTAAVSCDVVKFYGDNFKHHPVGSGPYCLASKNHLPEQRIVFTANPIYRGRADIDGTVKIPESEKLPKIKRLQLDYISESLPSWALFQQGLLDIGGIPKDTFSQAIRVETQNLTPEMKAKGILLAKAAEPTISYYGFNMEDPVVGKNKPLRQAMSMAFNRKEYIELFANGRGQPAIGPIPPGFPTYDPQMVNPYAVFDPAAARLKVAEAEKINGGKLPVIKLLMPGTDTSERQVAEFIKKQMRDIGLEIEPDFRTWARFQEMVERKQAQFYGLGWVADYPDEQTFLQLFWSKNVSPGPNSANYSNPEYDKLYEKAMVMEPGPERDQLYKEMSKMVIEDCPWMFISYPVSFTLYYDWVKNFRNIDYGHGHNAHLELDVESRRNHLKH